MCIFCETNDRHIDHRLTDAEILAADQCVSLRTRQLPVTVITGFLGAGKTTLVNWLLAGSHGRRFCVVQNEFGTEPIDDALIVRSTTFAEVAVITLASGCVCCKVRGDLADALKRLAMDLGSGGAETGAEGLDAVLIETSGLSEVAPVCVTLYADAFVQRHFRLDALSLADVVLLNKDDLASPPQMEAAAALARRLNPTAALLPCRRGQVEPEALLGLGAFSAARCVQLDVGSSAFAAGSKEPPLSFARRPTQRGARVPTAHAHESFGSVALVRAHDGTPAGRELDELAFTDWIEAVTRKHARRLLRAKGLLFFRDADAATVVQCVGSHVEIERVAPEQMPQLGERRSRLIFIGRVAGLEQRLREEFEAL